MDNERLTDEMTVEEVNELIRHIEMLRHATDSNNTTEEERKDIYFILGEYIKVLLKGRVKI